MECLIVFAKAPVAGEVKTRLAATAPLSPEDVCALYEAFLNDVLQCAANSRADKIFLNYTPASAGQRMAGIAQKYFAAGRLVMMPQAEGTFSGRIASSFATAEKMGGTRLVMIGSDSPHLQSRILDAAFATLQGGGAALGPSGEGGLYLIGLCAGIRPDWEKVFGGGAELVNLCREIVHLGGVVNLLEEITDVDVATDLVTAAALIETMALAERRGEFPQRTADELKRLRLTIGRNGGTRDKVLTRDG